jgi:urea carboxylase
MLEIKDGGFQTTVQDYPGRTGYWSVGIPPSGPMDPFAFRLGNKLVGNASGAAGFEMVSPGPTIEVQKDNVIAFTGADNQPMVDGERVPMWESVSVNAGQTITFGGVPQRGFRTYLCVSGGIDVPSYLDSKSTFFTYQGIGGYKGRTLQSGDSIKTGEPNGLLEDVIGRTVPDEVVPSYENAWEIRAVPGPEADPDYLTSDDMDLFFSYKWGINQSSNRIGVRLEGPDFDWARDSGGEGGEHPSNVLDRPYGIGNINVTGEKPVILTNDGPSLGGFVTIATIPQAELWKVGQAYPDRDTISFEAISVDEAIDLRKTRRSQLEQVRSTGTTKQPVERSESSSTVPSQGSSETAETTTAAPSNGGDPMRTYEIELQGETHTVDVEESAQGAYRIQLDGKQAELVVNDFNGSQGSITEAAGTTEAEPEPQAEPASEQTQARAQAKSEPADREAVVRAAMSGSVDSIPSSIGDEVAQGEVVLVMEAMKMTNDVTAPRSGTVTEIHVSVDDELEPNDPLVTIE